MIQEHLMSKASDREAKVASEDRLTAGPGTKRRNNSHAAASAWFAKILLAAGWQRNEAAEDGGGGVTTPPGQASHKPISVIVEIIVGFVEFWGGRCSWWVKLAGAGCVERTRPCGRPRLPTRHADNTSTSNTNTSACAYSALNATTLTTSTPRASPREIGRADVQL